MLPMDFNVTTNGIPFTSIVFGWRHSQNLDKENYARLPLKHFSLNMVIMFARALLAASLPKYSHHNTFEKPRIPKLVNEQCDAECEVTCR